MVRFDSLAGALAALRDQTVTEIALLEWSISVEGAKQIAETLKDNKTLTTLDLGGNRIGAEGAKHVADALKHNTTLTTLDLGWNDIGPEGARHVADALRHNTTLVTLDLGENEIGAVGINYITEALKDNKTLTTLNLTYNAIGAVGVKHITQALKDNKTLTTLTLTCNNIGAEGVNHIAEALKDNKTLTTLELEINNIHFLNVGDEMNFVSLTVLSNALQHNNTLLSLKVGFGDLKKDTLLHVAISNFIHQLAFRYNFKSDFLLFLESISKLVTPDNVDAVNSNGFSTLTNLLHSYLEFQSHAYLDIFRFGHLTGCIIILAKLLIDNGAHVSKDMIAMTSEMDVWRFRQGQFEYSFIERTIPFALPSQLTFYLKVLFGENPDSSLASEASSEVRLFQRYDPIRLLSLQAFAAINLLSKMTQKSASDISESFRTLLTRNFQSSLFAKFVKEMTPEYLTTAFDGNSNLFAFCTFTTLLDFFFLGMQLLVRDSSTSSNDELIVLIQEQRVSVAKLFSKIKLSVQVSKQSGTPEVESVNKFGTQEGPSSVFSSSQMAQSQDLPHEPWSILRSLNLKEQWKKYPISDVYPVKSRDGWAVYVDLRYYSNRLPPFPDTLELPNNTNVSIQRPESGSNVPLEYNPEPPFNLKDLSLAESIMAFNAGALFNKFPHLSAITASGESRMDGITKSGTCIVLYFKSLVHPYGCEDIPRVLYDDDGLGSLPVDVRTGCFYFCAPPSQAYFGTFTEKMYMGSSIGAGPSAIDTPWEDGESPRRTNFSVGYFAENVQGVLGVVTCSHPLIDWPLVDNGDKVNRLLETEGLKKFLRKEALIHPSAYDTNTDDKSPKFCFACTEPPQHEDAKIIHGQTVQGVGVDAAFLPLTEEGKSRMNTSFAPVRWNLKELKASPLIVSAAPLPDLLSVKETPFVDDKTPHKKIESVYKVGRTTGLTRGLLRHETAHVRAKLHGWILFLWQPKHPEYKNYKPETSKYYLPLVYHKQLKVIHEARDQPDEGRPTIDFLQGGDSGSLVWIPTNPMRVHGEEDEEDKERKPITEVMALGIGIGSITGTQCDWSAVTPISIVEEALGVHSICWPPKDDNNMDGIAFQDDDDKQDDDQDDAMDASINNNKGMRNGEEIGSLFAHVI